MLQVCQRDCAEDIFSMTKKSLVSICAERMNYIPAMVLLLPEKHDLVFTMLFDSVLKLQLFSFGLFYFQHNQNKFWINIKYVRQVECRAIKMNLFFPALFLDWNGIKL